MTISRKTKTVKLLLDLFNQTDNAIPVVELVSTFSSEMNKTTVYRILKKLEDSGVLHSFLDKDGLKGMQKEISDQRHLKNLFYILIFCVRSVEFQAVYPSKSLSHLFQII